VLVHAPADAKVSWEAGNYVVQITGSHQASERIVLSPLDEDWSKPYQEQRLRVSEVSVSQAGVELYHAELRDYRSVRTASPRRDPEGLEPDVPASGPSCGAEVPHAIRFRVPVDDRDVLFEQSGVEHNPPLIPGVFHQEQPAGSVRRNSACD
jgi:hypothetical protein